MSTRCTINFTHGKTIVGKVYRHSDGYPDTKPGVLADLQKFFAAVEAATPDTRFRDPSYLAAKFVVWQASQYGEGLNFLGVGLLSDDPGDIEYTYFVDCGATDGKGRPLVMHRAVRE